MRLEQMLCSERRWPDRQMSGCGDLYKQRVAAAVAVAGCGLRTQHIRTEVRQRCSRRAGVHHLNYSPLGTKAALEKEDVRIDEPVVPRQGGVLIT